ncbi:hypothetical protein [Clostridium sp. UBA871]|uniref:hypothetical protein n=1 Tax=Clostridium sp. UBA871 TaxID=1946380 RepID=UPI003216AFF8
MYIDRQYLKNTVLKVSQEKNIINATKKIQQMCGVPWYVIYDFTRKATPNEESLLKIIKCLNIDTVKLFVIN